MPSRERTVLFVDDDPVVLRALVKSLQGCPYRVLTVASAEEALRLLDVDRVDVLVADHQMPAMTGMDLLSKVSRRFPETARVLLTGQASLSLAIRAVNEGEVCRILTKPCRREDLLAAVNAALQRVESSSISRGAGSGAVPTNASFTSRKASSRPSMPAAARLPSAFHHLSSRELEVLALLARGDRVEQIAAAMFLSRHTVRNHLKAIFRKVGVHSQAELVGLARRSK
ncbi:MAG: response regulator [Myxococcota bacterium]